MSGFITVTSALRPTKRLYNIKDHTKIKYVVFSKHKSSVLRNIIVLPSLFPTYSERSDPRLRDIGRRPITTCTVIVVLCVGAFGIAVTKDLQFDGILLRRERKRASAMFNVVPLA